MKYLCLGYYDEKKFDAMPKVERDALIEKCRTHDEELHKSGHLILVASLAAPNVSRCLKPRPGAVSITDGPYAEAKEAVGAFFLIEAKDFDEAVRVASLHPAAHLGGDVGFGIEVRPIDFFVELSAEGLAVRRE